MRAHSLVVKRSACTGGSRVRFAVGPLFSSLNSYSLTWKSVSRLKKIGTWCCTLKCNIRQRKQSARLWSYSMMRGNTSTRRSERYLILLLYTRQWIAWLGSRRRTWQAAISWGEPHAGFEPQISEWENVRIYARAEKHEDAGNWNILVPAGKENKSDSLSSSERKGNRANWILLRKECRDVVVLRLRYKVEVSWNGMSQRVKAS